MMNEKEIEEEEEIECYECGWSNFDFDDYIFCPKCGSFLKK